MKVFVWVFCFFFLFLHISAFEWYGGRFEYKNLVIWIYKSCIRDEHRREWRSNARIRKTCFKTRSIVFQSGNEYKYGLLKLNLFKIYINFYFYMNKLIIDIYRNAGSHCHHSLWRGLKDHCTYSWSTQRKHSSDHYERIGKSSRLGAWLHKQVIT